MSDISKIKLPNGDVYNLKDSEALHQGDATTGAIQGITKQGSSIITITDAANNYPLEELKVNFEPYQEGSGDSSPENIRPISGWDGCTVYRAGKNLFDISIFQNKSGIAVDGSTFYGKASAFNAVTKTYVPFLMSAGTTFTVKASTYRSISDTGSGWAIVFYYADGTSIRPFYTSNSVTEKTDYVGTITAEKDIVYYTFSYFNNAETGIWYVSDLQIEIGSTATSYESYTATSYPVTWQSAGTVYGGYADLIRGVLVATHECITSTWGNFRNKTVLGDNTRGVTDTINNAKSGGGTNSICNVAKKYWNYTNDTTHFYADGAYAYVFLPNNTNENLEIQITYQLTDPITYPLTPTEIRIFSGVNNFWSNIGTISSITYAQDTKSFIQENSVRDVQLNNESIVSEGIANIPIGSASSYGVFKRGSGLYDTDGVLGVNSSSDTNVKNGTTGTFTTVSKQHLATFYGLAKAAGADEKDSSLTAGQYTDTAKAAIQHMIGTDAAITSYEADSTADRSYEVGDTFMMDGKLYKVTAIITQGGVITPNGNCVETCIDNTYVKDVQIKGSSIISNGTANIPEMSETVAGVVKRGSGLYINSSGQLCSNIGTATTIKQGTASSAIAPISLQGNTIFYGLAKAAGDTTQSASSNAVGTYTTEAKSAIQTMLNVPDTSEVVNDVQINSTSIISNGIANIPLASTTDIGVAKIGDTMSVSASGFLNFRAVGASEVKGGTSYMRALTPERQHASVFYGLAKAAGADMSSSSNAIGTYTDEAKSAINSMLSAPEIINGTTPSIEAKANIQYICGECSTLNITIPANGIVDIIFQSGSTPTILTITPPTGMTIKWPGWFNPNQLEANYTYEINILNGVYGVVMLWA